MGRIVAIAGGDLVGADAINQYAMSLTGINNPNVLFIGTASRDAEEYVEKITEYYTGKGCPVRILALTQQDYTPEQLDEILGWAQLIYVGGGDTNYMMRTWERLGIDSRMKEIYENDRAVLTGVSAGAICWFSFGHSDSDGLIKEPGDVFGWVENMLGFYEGAFCPHYDEEDRDSFDGMLAKRESVGIALDNYAAFADNNGEISYIRCAENARGYRFEPDNGSMKKTQLPLKML